MLTRTNQEIPSPANQSIIEMITTIIMYKFENLKRQEVESMLGITLKETQVYREIKEEGREEGLKEGLEQGLKQGKEEGLEEGAFNLVMRLLTKRFGKISKRTRAIISSLSLHNLEDLSEALLDFQSLDDLMNWLDEVEDEDEN